MKNGHTCKKMDTRAKKWTRVQKYGHTCKNVDMRSKNGHACKNMDTRANIRTQTKFGHEFYKLTQRYRHVRNYTC